MMMMMMMMMVMMCVDIACVFYTSSWYVPCVIKGDQPYWGGPSLSETGTYINTSIHSYTEELEVGSELRLAGRADHTWQ